MRQSGDTPACVYTRAEELAKQYTREGRAYPSYLGLVDAMAEAGQRRAPGVEELGYLRVEPAKEPGPRFSLGPGDQKSLATPDEVLESDPDGLGQTMAADDPRLGQGSFSLTGERRDTQPRSPLPFGAGLGLTGGDPVYPYLTGWAAHPHADVLCGGEEDCR